MWQNNDYDKIKNHLHTESFCFKTDGFVLYVQRHRLHTTKKKKTIQPNNKAPRRSPSFGSIVSFVMTVAAKRPNIGMVKL